MDISAKVQIWREKAKAGTLSHEEMKEAIQALRAGRASASVTSSAARTSRAKKAPVNSDDLLAQLEGSLKL